MIDTCLLKEKNEGLHIVHYQHILYLLLFASLLSAASLQLLIKTQNLLLRLLAGN